MDFQYKSNKVSQQKKEKSFYKKRTAFEPEIISYFFIFFFFRLVGYAGFEPATSPLSGVRSNQLS